MGEEEAGEDANEMDWTSCSLQEVKLLPYIENRGVWLNQFY